MESEANDSNLANDKSKAPKVSRRTVLTGLVLGGVCAGLFLEDADCQDLLAPSRETEDKPKNGSKVPLFYSKGYNISAFGLEHLHPFDGRKYQKIYEALTNPKGPRRPSSVERPAALSEAALLKVHSKEYLESLGDSRVLSRILEVGILAKLPAGVIDWRILKPMRLAAGGTMAACRAALQRGLAINIGGGYHHADKDQGGGFCVYCDIPIAIKTLRQEGLLKTALIVDTDAHQGNGFANVAREESQLFVLDYFDESIYPHPKVKEDWSIPFPRNTDGRTYLSELKSTLPVALEKFKPDLVAYNAGSDVLDSDPLSTFRLKVAEMNERDLFVVETTRRMNIPLAMVLAGGYGKDSARAHTKSIESILARFDGRTG